LWGFIFPALSDRLGRKPVLIFLGLLSAIVPLTYRSVFLIAHPWLMAATGFVANGGQGIAALAIVLIPAETAPIGFAATAIGLATLFGEIFGGALSPAVAGVVADRYGLAAPLWIASAGAIVVFLAATLMKESSPRKRVVDR
jgi:MFS family permease